MDHSGRFIQIAGDRAQLGTTATAYHRIAARNTVKIQAADGRFPRVAGGKVTAGSEGSAFRLG